MSKVIKSSQNLTIKHLVKLRKDSKYRKKNNLALIMGKKMVFELKEKISTLIISNEKYLKDYKSKEIILVTDQIMKKITNLENPEGIAALIPLPKKTNLDNKKYILVLDKISDPGNLGTLIRSAHGLGFEGIIITPMSVDPYNEKALRAAKGSSFIIPISFHNDKEIKSYIQKNKMNVYIADILGKDVNKTKFLSPLLLVLSSESKGISSWAKKLNKITIPMQKSIDSLNVAIAGSILMFYVTKN